MLVMVICENHYNSRCLSTSHEQKEKLVRTSLTSDVIEAAMTRVSIGDMVTEMR